MEATFPNVGLGVTWRRRLGSGRGFQRGWRWLGQYSGRGSHRGLNQLTQLRGWNNGHPDGDLLLRIQLQLGLVVGIFDVLRRGQGLQPRQIL